MASTFKKTGLKKTSVLLLLQLLAYCVMYGKQIPTVTGILKTDPLFSTPVEIGMPSAMNTIFVLAVPGTADYNVQNTISLKYDLNTDTFFLAPTHVRVSLKINLFDASGNPISTFNRDLSVRINNNLNRPILEESTVNLTGAYQIDVAIMSIWVNGMPVNTLPRYVSVESAINMDRYYDFSLAANTVPANTQLNALDNDCDGNPDEVELVWSVPAAVPEEYQVEWTFVSSYARTTGNYPASAFETDFKNNSTRITTTGNSYRVSLVYPAGYLVFRVRAVGRDYLNPTSFMYGDWNVADQVNIGSLTAFYKYATTAHESVKNWQYSGTYAEEGKKKEVINYSDGSLHNRQTVTKINSDNNVIVGEGLYDFQGRPAVSILPVPVNLSCGTAPSLKYYSKFNVDDTNKVYSKNDFDLDVGGACVSGVAPMDTISGASQYYSNNNPNKNAQQAFLPHAKEYPFTQTEYTPDNTGRIRRQSGVGKDYRLGSGKETKYLYGQPNQLQLDRLFGSEAGDASHYKKNVVIDANGQTSVTYLNQEGKTIATALAGIPPTIGASPVTRMDSLDYSAQNQSQYTVDMFNKNALGVSNLNTVPPSGDQLCFSTQLLVPFRSTYDFRYTLQVNNLSDVCLRANVCVSCVYDMEIHVMDECGMDLVSTVSPFKPIKRVTGDVDTTGNKLTFNVTCLNPGLFKDSAKVSLVLQPGVYTISKILKVNQQSKDYYLGKYADSLYNSCVKTLNYFRAAELAQVDTADCYNSCAGCVTALGSRDDFVAAGRGTAEQWDFLLLQCNEPCRLKTLCEVTYEMMLSDVSPGGQYGKFDQSTYSAFNEPLSVYNINNVLRPNNIPGQQAHWKSPFLLLNGNTYNMYLDENGVRTKINLAEISPGVFQPAVSNPALVFLDNSTNIKYTYPENLQNLSDFIANWNPNYARSLVVFHPEYAYYVSCKDHAVTFPGDARSSDNLDSLLFATESFNQAFSAGFINALYSLSTPAINKITPIWTTASGPYDPFFTNTTFQYQTTPNPVTGAQTNITMSGGSYYNISLQTEMNNKINFYKVVGPNAYTMPDIAALLTRCGNTFSNSIPPAACLAFGQNFYVTPPYSGANDTIRNREWRLYRQLYFAEKQKLQFKRMNFYAKYGNDPNSNYYGGCNACIGNSGFSMFGSGMITHGAFVPNGYPLSPFFDSSQPCGSGSYLNYPGVVKRFYDPANTGLDYGNAALSLFQITGQCPLVYHLQNLLSAMAGGGKLTANPVDLSQVSEFNIDLYNAVNGLVPPSSFVNYSWQASTAGSILTADLIEPVTGTLACKLKLDITGTSIPNFASIIGINQMQATASGPAGDFTAVAVYTSGSNTLSANITGTISCINLENCSFPEKCSPNQFATDMLNLLSYLEANNQLGSPTMLALSTDPVLSLLLTPAIKNTLGSGSFLVHQIVAPNKWNFWDLANPSTRLVFTYTVTPPAAWASVKTFANIQGSSTNLYSMDALDVNGNVIATITGEATRVTSTQTTDLILGTCGTPERLSCTGKEFQVSKDLEGLISQVLSTKPFNSNVDIYNLASFTPLLKSYKSGTITATSSTYTSGTGPLPNFDTLTIRFTTSPSGVDSDCNIKLFHYRYNPTFILNFPSIVSVSKLTGIGTPDIAGNYFYFKALATYFIGTNVTDTIYGYSCWPIKNCEPCKYPIQPNANPTNTYTYSTGYDRINGVPYNPVPAGSYDSYWTIIKTQPVIASPPYTVTGSPTFYGPPPLAYNITPNPSPVTIPIASGGYISINSTYSSTVRQLVTFKTSFTLPNPLPSNKSYSLMIGARADDAIYRISVNGTDLFTGVAGSSYVGSPATVGVDTETGSLLVSGNNDIEIDAVDQGLYAFEMGAEVLLTEWEKGDRPCHDGPPDSTFVFPPYTKYDNPCVRQKINLALQNAANDYQQYVDSVTTVFADKYTKHCLGALENFTYKYVDKEYHHTLYYYDQAGNLVRTIPPEGVDYLPITAYTNGLEQQIISDRTNGQQTVFTNHRMPTKYVYNSLNQLTYQSLPDHDNMAACDGLNPNGLDTGLIVNAIHFVSPTKGYLCGYIKRAGSFNRGFVYTSNDGGNYWTRVNGVTSGDLQKVQFVSTSTGFAVSTFGMVFKTTDGGNKWDLLTGLYNPLSGSRYVDVLNDLYFSSSSFGVVGGIAQGSGSPIFFTNNGGGTFAPASVPGASVGDTITGFAFDGTTYIASARNGNTGKLFYSTTGTVWSRANTGANNLKRVQFISNSLAFAVGEEGTLMKLSQPITGNPVFQLVPTGVLGDFRDVYFKNATDGVAIIDSIPNRGKIFKTFDGGITWQQLSANGEYYNSLQLYNASSHKLIAAGRDGRLVKVLLNLPPFGITKIGTPNTNHISYADAVDNGASGMSAVGVSDVSSNIFTCYNAQLANPTWLTVNLATLITPADALFKKVILLSSSPTAPDLKGILLTTNGKLYSFYRQYNNTVMICGAVNITGGFTGKFFNDITANSQTFSTRIYAFDSIAKQNHELQFSGTSAAGTLFTGSVSRNINAIDINNSSNNLIMVGNSGHIEYTSNIVNPTTWADVSLASIPVAVTKVRAVTTNTFIAGGIDGALWQSFGGPSTWYLKKSGTTEKINSMAVVSSGGGLIAANNGKLFRLSSALTQFPALTGVATGISAHLTDVAIEPGGSSAYITANNGQVLYTTNYSSSAPSQAAAVSPLSANGVAFKASANAMVVGNTALAANYFGTSAIITKDLFTRGLNSIHFFDANTGYVIDSSNVIRRTLDGGNTWSVILPISGSPMLTKIYATQADAGVLIGLNKLVVSVTGTGLSSLSVPSSVPNGTHFYDIGFNAARTYGYIVGSNTQVVKIAGSTITNIGQPATGRDFRTVHVFNNNTFLAAGTRGAIWYYKGGAFTKQMSYTPPAGIPQSGTVFKDMYFHDAYKGYIVGDDGAAFMADMNDSIGSVGTITDAMPWKYFCNRALYMNYSSNGQLRNLDFNAIACPSRATVMIAGSDSNIVIGGFKPNRYARLLKEQSGYYSTRFWYDKLGRLVLSQNTKQFNKQDPATPGVSQAFSYTLYDALGRITEVGEKYENQTSYPQMNSIFGSLVNGYYNNSAVDDSKFLAWLASPGNRREVTKTYYDAQNILSGLYQQENLRKRVATTTFEDAYDGNDFTYNHATHYSYDIHGNVKTLWQENPQLSGLGQDVKQTDYQYDLVSGKVNKVVYAPGQPDQFIHRYAYDADNRITRVESSSNDLHYDLEAKYFYYAHGPLARVEYGKAQVQGMDYAYTLQGWIKGVNSNSLKQKRDMGRDGYLTVPNPNANFGRDIMGYTLNYYRGDYDAIDYVKWNTASKRFEAYTSGSDLSVNSYELYNGNISSMVAAISRVDTNLAGTVTGAEALPLGSSYRYDQLSRLTRSNAYTNLDTAGNFWKNSGASNLLYRNKFSYDANGNIKMQVKFDSIGGRIDSLTYNYETDGGGELLRNRLYHVNDFVSGTPPNLGDVTDQGPFSSGSGINSTNNYSFDEIGNLIKDNAEEIDSIRWMVTGKIKAIVRRPGSSRDNLYFDYDAAGNRVAKHVYNSFNNWKSSTFYLRDAQGNVLSVYDKRMGGTMMSYKQKEQHLYGSSRIGMALPELEMIGVIAPPDTTKSYLGYKEYEMSNHLGNVLTVVSDKKIALDDNSDNVIDYYLPDVINSTDYYAFGQQMYGRRFNYGICRYGFNGKEKDDDVKGVGNSLDFGARIYDTRLGRWLSLDPLQAKYPELSPYNFVANNPIIYVDPDGKDIVDSKGRTAVRIDKSGSIEYTEYATADIKRVVSSMIVSSVGKQITQDMVTAPQKITITISKETLYKNPKTGETSTTKKEGFSNIVGGDTKSTSDGKGGLAKADITVYEGSIDKLIKTPNQSMYTKEEHVGNIGVHEGTHATDKDSNSKTAKPGTNVEEKPKENEKLHKNELKEKKQKND